MSGSTMVRVWTALIGVWKISMPSRKKGRFSSKKMGKRWLAVTTVRVGLDLREVGVDGEVERHASA